MTYEVEPVAVSLSGDVMNVPMGTVIDASVRTSKCVLRGICVYRTATLEFVVTSQTVVEESQLAPAVNGQWMICGGFSVFFQAEDGIRDYKVTGVQTCALPI